MQPDGSAKWRYKATDSDGKRISGVIDATSQDWVVRHLLSKGQYPLSVEEASGRFSREFRIGGNRVSRKDLGAAIRQLAALRKTGFPLERALTVISGEDTPAALKDALLACRRTVDNGGSLSEAFNNHPTVFPPVLCSLVEAGETSGRLQETLEVAARALENDARIRSKIRGAVTYPSVVFAAGLTITLGLIYFVVPVFSGVFSKIGGELPLPTQILIYLSRVLPFVLLIFATALTAAVIWYRRNRLDPRVREKRDALFLKAPAFRRINLWSATARFCRTFAALQGAGVPVPIALPMAGRASGIYQIERTCLQARDLVQQGRDLSSAIDQPGSVLPSLVRQTIEVGESSGSLDSLLTEIAAYYEFEAEEAANRLDKTLEPLILMVVGGMVLAVVIGLYSPILGITQQVGNMTGS